ncbi:phenylacetic acid degradation operon negative regulatory protein PaaX [Massilia horti]|uniref:Phenylacetic acid degradation operon negative regulatory protein PaaX n=1 Tax=Massilia horti TaxID=2562153 RepID=A0A4Y9T3U2_9BURK|nr:phenylacetic acid degradation operon negative regulatory protein PaaX [Massilia horti]TFW32206.1 phenylacetic acid degradation operon negative regulatory protein PaaX [Massilia horti]
MKQLSSDEWVAQFLAQDPPRAKSLVMTVFGDSVAAHGGAIWLGSLIELLAPLGLADRLVRTSVFRLVQEGWLMASREGRRSRYALEPRALPRLERANHRIYAKPGLDWDGRWTLLIAPNGSIDADLRAAVRKELQWEGFSMLAPGVLAHPAPNVESLAEVMARVGAVGKVFACSVDELPGIGARPLRELVNDGWDLAPVIAAYRQFSERFAPLLALLRKDQNVGQQAAFAIRSLLIHAYRRVQLHDPMLPLELLPAPWPGSDAYELARDIYHLVFEQAEEYLMAVLRREDEQALQADAAFYERFGGLC